MASDSKSFHSVQVCAIILLLIFQIMSSFSTFSNNTSNDSLNYQNTIQSSQFVDDFDIDYGFELGGQTIDFDDLNQATVRYENNLRISYSNLIQNHSNGIIGTPDVVISDHQEVYACWINDQGGVFMYSLDLTGNSSLMQVDTLLDVNNHSSLVDCAIEVKENNRTTLLYANSTHLKAAQIAFETPLYSNGDAWHTRTILEDVNVTNIELSITPNQIEWGAFRDDLGRLYRVNYSGAYWQTGLLDEGPVGEDFELSIDSNGVISIFYTKAHQAILKKISNGIIENDVIYNGSNLHQVLGLTTDDSGLQHMFSSSIEGNDTILNIKRSLANQPNQIDSTPISNLISEVENSSINSIHYGDFNSDGYDDVVFSEYDAGTSSLSENGMVSAYYGSEFGLSSSPDHSWYGMTDYANFGQGIAVGDYDGDGYSDLAISSPGINSNDGKVEFTFGSSNGLSQSLIEIAGVSVPTLTGNRYGSCLETVQDLESDGKDEILICSSEYSDNGDTGLIQLFSGDLSTSNWIELNGPNQILQGPNYGQSVSASGDLNGDGINDLVVGNTGTLIDPSGYSSVEVRYGSSNGFNQEPDVSIQSFSTDTLFGYEVEIINDLNNDGFDELFISEPYNLSNEFNSGSVWIYLGNNTSLNTEPEFRLNGAANELLGLNFASAGDSNGDGYNDFLITKRGSSNSGKLLLYLGSNDGFEQNGMIVTIGNNDLGLAISSGADSDGDGMDEYFASQTVTDDDFSKKSTLGQYSRKVWDDSELTIPGLVTQAKIQTSTEGSPTIVYSVNNSGKHLIQLLSITKDSQTGNWLMQNLSSTKNNFLSCGFETTSSGEPIVFITDEHAGIFVNTFDSYTSIESLISTINNDVNYLDSAIDSEGNYYVSYYSPTSSNLYLKSSIDGIWSEQLVQSSVSTNADVGLHINSSNNPTIVYFDNSTNQIMTSHNQSGWNFQSINSNNQNLVGAFSSLILPDDNLTVVTILDDGNNQNLTLINWDGFSAQYSVIATQQDFSSNVSISIDNNGDLIVSTFSTSGVLTVHELHSGIWSSASIPQSNRQTLGNQILSTGGEFPAIAVSSDNDSVLVRNNGIWESIANAPSNFVGGNWDLISNDTHVILLTESSDSEYLQWNSIPISNTTQNATWYTATFQDTITDFGITSAVSNDSTISITLHDSREIHLTHLRLYLDRDGDHIFDKIDNLPLIPNQWSDLDGDGYGENPMAPLNDDCIDYYGLSYIATLGCLDTDGDGYYDYLDNCNVDYGFSWLDNKGCTDFDQDGWSDSIVGGVDIFSHNWKQAFDSDGDQYGDNHGPDCCDTWYDDDARDGDAFPYNPRQYQDIDGDGYGDNQSDFEFRDDCRFDYGTSYRDRLGCLDSDGDGSSDSTPSWGTTACGTQNGFCADLWPDDPTQWADSDGDGYGDNSSVNATMPDHFPSNIVASNDTDNDGYPDEFSEFYNGSNSGGLYIDGCPTIAGNSTKPLFGCLDSDGDGYMDTYTYDIDPNTGLRVNQSGDVFPFDDSQWHDMDGDGFGDSFSGSQADQCIQVPGQIDGTLGIGCPIVDGNDDDSDSIINENDNCPNTTFGLQVNANGCATNQLDSDGDGVTDDIDICQETSESGVDIDSDGCSKSQRESDSDGDLVFDFEDVCPNTPNDETADQLSPFKGCSPSQKDTDEDGVTDAIDECPDTQNNIIVTSNGCKDEILYQIDVDGDGYAGENDFMPEDPTQWQDSDGDGYGDNQSGFQGDQCPQTSGNSFQDRFGCIDSDLDGWSDSNTDWPASPSGLGDAFPDNPSQWRDSDGDGVGDNISGTEPDLCSNTNIQYKNSVDKDGCAEYQRDTDQDGVVDSLDNCPTEAKGIDGNLNGCPIEKQEEVSDSTEIFGLSITIFIILCVSIVLLLVVIIIFINREDEEEDWYDDDDDFDDDDYEENKLSFLDNQRQSRPKPPMSRPPVAPPKPRSAPIETTSFTPRKISNAPERSAPIGLPKYNNHPSIPIQSTKKRAKKVRKSDSQSNKIKRAVVEIEEDIFENVDKELIESTISDVISNGLNNERKILMILQENGWNARQSRAIINMAKKRSR